MYKLLHLLGPSLTSEQISAECLLVNKISGYFNSAVQSLSSILEKSSSANVTGLSTASQKTPLLNGMKAPRIQSQNECVFLKYFGAAVTLCVFHRMKEFCADHKSKYLDTK